MGPKKKEIQDENAWRNKIEDSPLNDDKWTVKVIMMEAAGGDQDRLYLTKFETFAAEEKRFVIKNICKTETHFMVNQLGGEKKIKDENLRVFEEGQAYLKDKKDIPSDVSALIIKYLIIKMKDEYLYVKRQRLEVKEGMRRESSTMIDRAEVRGTAVVKPPTPPPPPPPPKKGKKAPVTQEDTLPEPDEGKKYNTLLRVRGEEWRDKVYVDDFPVDGPDLYVAVTGFGDPELPGWLLKIGVPLTAIVQIRIDPTSIKIPSSLVRPTKRGQSTTDMLMEKSLKFWDDLQKLRIAKTTAEDFKQTCFMIFTPPYWNATNLSGNPDKIYDELCFLMYDIQDLSRQHIHYLENMDIVEVPISTIDDRFFKYYDQQMDGLPLECVTVYSLLDSVLQTVCETQDMVLSSQTSLQSAQRIDINDTDDIKTKQAEGLVKDVFEAFANDENIKKSYRITYGEEYEEHKDPIIINYGDLAKYPTFHLGNINLDNIVLRSLLGMPVHNLWRNQERPHGELEAKLNFHVNVLLSCFDRRDVETAELSRMLHILACRKLFNNRSSLRKCHLQPSTITEFKKIYLKRSIMAEPLPKCQSLILTSSTSHSFPSITKSENESIFTDSDDNEIARVKFLFDCPDISELVSAAEIANDKPINHLIDDFEYFEDHKKTSAFQILLDAYNKFNCLDYKYCEVTDCILLMFYNSHDRDGVARDEWRRHLDTPLCLQDFFDYVLEEQFDWIKNEEIRYDESIMNSSQSVNKETLDPMAPKSCIETTDVAADLLIEGSLKFQEMIELEDIVQEDTLNKTTSSKLNSGSRLTSDSRTSKKTKSPATSTPRRGKVAPIIAPPEILIKEPPKPFLGYDLGDRRVEVFGKDSKYFSKDGTMITTLYYLIIPMNLEYVFLNVVPGNGNNQFWVQRAVGELEKPEMIDLSESFRITSKDGVLINIRKRTYELSPLQLAQEGVLKGKESAMRAPSQKISHKILIPDIHVYHSLYITLPNGLVTETVHEDNSSKILHIKQTYLNPYYDEEMRCISLNGEVIIFKKSGDIEVLCPYGMVIKITKYEKRIVIPDIPDDVQTESSSDKGKTKPKLKQEKKNLSKASSKMSKSFQDEEIEPEKAPEYELIFDEYEFVETNGMRTKFENEQFTEIEKLLIRTATDYCLGEIFSRRMDHTNTLLNKDGVQTVTFPNGTRILTYFVVEENEIYPEWTEEEMDLFDLYSYDDNLMESETVKSEKVSASKGSMSQKSGFGSSYTTSFGGSVSKKMEDEDSLKDIKRERNDGYISVQTVFTVEHANFTTVTIDKASAKVIVDSPNNARVTAYFDNSYEFLLDSVTSAKFNGEVLHIDYEACPKCQSNTTCNIKIRSDDKSSVSQIHRPWCKLTDSFCKKVSVNEEGGIAIVDQPDSEELLRTDNIDPTDRTETHESAFEETKVGFEEKSEDGRNTASTVTVGDRNKSEASMFSHGRCGEMYQAKTMRFFVMKRDLTCSELIHRGVLDEYTEARHWLPWYSRTTCDSFGDKRRLVSILAPLHLNETEKWLMDSKLAAKPKYLTFKDLKEDTGKGFYHWMRPYKRFEPRPMKPDNNLPPRLPRAYVHRTLEQQWTEQEREQLKGAKELLTAILKYRRVMEEDSETLLHVPIIDLRGEAERKTDRVLQALGHRIYEDLQRKLEEDVHSRAKADITTKPPLVPEEASVSDEAEEEDVSVDYLKCLEEQRASHIRELEAAVEPSPNLKRYWRRRAEELREEEFFKYLLREGSVPPYFRNVLGGAIWWEMNDTAGEAVTKAERRKMKCVCAEEASHVHESESGPADQGQM